MFYGHIGVALVSKPLAPKASIGVLLIAATTIDLLCGIFTAIGIESVDMTTGISKIPWSHGLFMSVVWSILVFIITYFITRNSKMSIVLGLLVFSHWILDFISHPMGMGKTLPKDLPVLFDNSLKVGLGLYNSVVAALITELGLLAAGIFVYMKMTKAKDRTGKWSIFVLILFLALFPLTMYLPSTVSPYSVFLIIFMLPIGIWIDRHRTFVPGIFAISQK
jgi:hypothetical protein